MIAAGPRCGGFSPSATSRVSRCSHTERWLKARWSPTPSLVGPRSGTRSAVPAVCFTDPEIVAVGQGAEQVKAAGIDAVVAEFPFRANGRALASERGDGFVRVLARKDDGVLLGLQAVGESVSELSAAFGLALEMGARLEDVAATIHAHPTRSEAFHEACLKALGRPLHA